jgi:hypothetical protein
MNKDRAFEANLIWDFEVFSGRLGASSVNGLKFSSEI